MNSLAFLVLFLESMNVILTEPIGSGHTHTHTHTKTCQRVCIKCPSSNQCREISYWLCI